MWLVKSKFKNQSRSNRYLLLVISRAIVLLDASIIEKDSLCAPEINLQSYKENFRVDCYWLFCH